MARDASGYAEKAGGGCFSETSVSEEDPSISSSVPEETSGADCVAERLAEELTRDWRTDISFSFFVGAGTMLAIWGGGGNCEAAICVDL